MYAVSAERWHQLTGFRSVALLLPFGGNNGRQSAAKSDTGRNGRIIKLVGRGAQARTRAQRSAKGG